MENTCLKGVLIHLFLEMWTVSLSDQYPAWVLTGYKAMLVVLATLRGWGIRFLNSFRTTDILVLNPGSPWLTEGALKNTSAWPPSILINPISGAGAQALILHKSQNLLRWFCYVAKIENPWLCCWSEDMMNWVVESGYSIAIGFSSIQFIWWVMT